MTITNRRHSKELQHQLTWQLSTTLAHLKQPTHIHEFLSDFLTPAEQLTLAKRLQIGQLLAQGTSYDLINKQLKVSTATISSVAEARHRWGWQLALKHLLKSSWSTKVSGWLKKPAKTKTNKPAVTKPPIHAKLAT